MDIPERKLNFRVEEVYDDSHLTEEELQAQIEAKFDALFGPLNDDDSDDNCTWE